MYICKETPRKLGEVLRALHIHGLVEILDENGEALEKDGPGPVYHWTDDRPEDLTRPVVYIDFKDGHAVLTVGPVEEPRPAQEEKPYNLDAEEVEILRGMEDSYRDSNGGELTAEQEADLEKWARDFSDANDMLDYMLSDRPADANDMLDYMLSDRPADAPDD